MAEAPVSHYTPLSTSYTSVVSYQAGWNILLEEVSRNTERALKEGKLLEVVSVVRDTVGTLSQTPVSIAVTGDSGNGMSSFINALRVIGHDEEASAPIGVVRTTQTRACYSSSRFPNVVLWDLPGLGARSQSMENYLEEMQFSTYDLFIIIASEQFSSNHVKLAKIIQKMAKKVYIVWTKLDRDLSLSGLSEVWLLQSIKGNIQENLKKERVQEPPIFLVSSLDPLLHDFPKLRDTLQKDLANIRCCGPLETLYCICEKVIDEKATSQKGRVASGYLHDMLGIRDADDLEECLKAYRLLFGVDNESLQHVAQRMGALVMEYRALMKCQDFHTLRRWDWRLKLMTCAVMNLFCRLLGHFPCLCHRVVHCFRGMKHRRILSLVAQDTKTILRKILKDSIVSL